MNLSLSAFLLAYSLPSCLGFAPISSSSSQQATRDLTVRFSTPRPRSSVSSEKEADRMFAKYDTDSNGVIDKNEFRAISKKLRKDASRSQFISVATASLCSIFVATSSNTFQYGQKKLRNRYLEQPAEDIQDLLFPTAMLSGDVDRKIYKTLKSRGFTPENTIFGHSVCSDEVNNRRGQLVPLMVDRWQEGFTLGGLAGIPFAGKSGFGGK